MGLAQQLAPRIRPPIEVQAGASHGVNKGRRKQNDGHRNEERVNTAEAGQVAVAPVTSRSTVEGLQQDAEDVDEDGHRRHARARAQRADGPMGSVHRYSIDEIVLLQRFVNAAIMLCQANGEIG